MDIKEDNNSMNEVKKSRIGVKMKKLDDTASEKFLN